MIRRLLAFARGENPVKGQKRGRAIKDAVSEGRQFNRRAAQSFIFVVIASLLILGRYFYLQVISHEEFTTRSTNNRVKVVPVAPNRGDL